MTTGIGENVAAAIGIPLSGFSIIGGLLFCGRSIYPILDDKKEAENPKNLWPWQGNLSWATTLFGGIPLATHSYNLLTSAEKIIRTVKMVFAGMATHLAVVCVILALRMVIPLGVYTVCGGLGGLIASSAIPFFLKIATVGAFYGFLIDIFIRYHCSQPTPALS